MLSHVWLCHHIDCSLPGSSAHGISQTRILERVAISFSRGSSRPRDGTHGFYVSCISRQAGRWYQQGSRYTREVQYIIIADEKFLVSIGSSSTLYYIVSFLWVFIHYFPPYIVSSLKAGTTFCLAVYPQHLEEYLKYNRCK